MKKTLKIFSILALALGFAACSSDEFQPGNPSTATSTILFSEDNVTEPELIIGQDNSFDVTFTRSDATAKQTIKLISKCTQGGVVCDSVLVVPDSVTFIAGQSVASITITMDKDFVDDTDYILDLRIPEENTNSYKTNSIMSFNVKRTYPDDWKDYAPVTYGSEWADGEWNDELQYSESRQAYRVKEWLGYEGYSLTFTWNQATGEIALWPEEPLNTGEDDGYGYIWVYSDSENPFSYDAETKTFTFPLDFYEPDDDYDYGTCTETITINEEGEGDDDEEETEGSDEARKTFIMRKRTHTIRR